MVTKCFPQHVSITLEWDRLLLGQVEVFVHMVDIQEMLLDLSELPLALLSHGNTILDIFQRWRQSRKLLFDVHVALGFNIMIRFDTRKTTFPDVYVFVEAF